jgi:uncharacterized protein YhfF
LFFLLDCCLRSDSRTSLLPCILDCLLKVCAFFLRSVEFVHRSGKGGRSFLDFSSAHSEFFFDLKTAAFDLLQL